MGHNPNAYDVALALIAALPATIAAATAALQSYRTHQKQKILQTTIDGQLSQRLAETATAAHAEGVLQERTDPHAEQP